MKWLKRLLFRRFTGRWVVIHSCMGCGEYLTRHEVFYAGSCPHCGLLPDGTILDNERHCIRRVRDEHGGPARIEIISRPSLGEHAL